MNTLVRTAQLGTLHDSRIADGVNEFAGAMPIVIFARAVRELMRKRAHKRAVLQAFRR